MNQYSGDMVDYWRHVVAGSPASDQRRVVAQAELGAALLDRYRVVQAQEDLIEAIVVLETAIRALADSPLAMGLDTPEGVGAVLSFVEAALRMWDDPATAEVLRSIILAASHEPFAMERLRSVFSALVLQIVSASLPHDEAEVRANLVSTQIVGLAMTRYVWAIDRIAEIPSEQIIRLVAPTVQHYLTGALGEDIPENA
ncbi:TetR/AcrR family transcriptional regulator [Nocardia gipuzkoensis]